MRWVFTRIHMEVYRKRVTERLFFFLHLRKQKANATLVKELRLHTIQSNHGFAVVELQLVAQWQQRDPLAATHFSLTTQRAASMEVLKELELSTEACAFPKKIYLRSS